MLLRLKLSLGPTKPLTTPVFRPVAFSHRTFIPDEGEQLVNFETIDCFDWLKTLEQPLSMKRKNT